VTGALAVGHDAPFLDVERIDQLIELRRVLVDQAGIADVADGEPGIGHRRGRAAGDAQEYLVDEGLAVTRINP